jgi:putative ABC transport system ATP-binding protein
MIEINNLVFSFPQSNSFSLRIPHLFIDKGEQCCIIGPSGSGKTTLINLISGICKPTQGKIKIGDLDITVKNDKPLREFRLKNIGFVFQDFCLLDYCTVRDNIILPFYLCQELFFDRIANQRLNTLLQILDISHKKNSAVQHLSQGEKQRVSIARALITQPRVMLCDEATGNLDPVAAHNVLKHILSVSDHFHTTLLFITHNMEIKKQFKRVIDMKEYN